MGLLLIANPKYYSDLNNDEILVLSSLIIFNCEFLGFLHYFITDTFSTMDVLYKYF